MKSVKLKEFKKEVDKSYDLKGLQEAERIISAITRNNLSEESWIKFLRASLGYLRDSIKRLEKK